ncbi:hypothetical protein HDU78_009144 [Chytriomyces hyalinus]|nr:hypothetical protein HDU78_009144 [Chytriomyces hyalinus]
MRSFILPLALSTLAAAQTFTTCAAWGTTCFNAVRPNTCIGLDPICFSPSPTQVCAACKCKDGPSKGELQGGTVNIGISADVCSQFFATNSTPTSLSSGPVLGGSSSVSTTAKAAESGSPAPTSAAAAPAASAKSAGAAMNAGYALLFGAVAMLV